MTALVSLLFIAMIPIDCKIKNFPYTFYAYSGHYKMANQSVKLVTPKNRTSKVWQYFGFPQRRKESVLYDIQSRHSSHEWNHQLEDSFTHVAPSNLR